MGSSICIKYQSSNIIYKLNGVNPEPVNSAKRVILILTEYSFQLTGKSCYSDSKVHALIDKQSLDDELTYLYTKYIDVVYITMDEVIIFYLVQNLMKDQTDGVIWHHDDISYVIKCDKNASIYDSYKYKYQMEKDDLIYITQQKNIKNPLYCGKDMQVNNLFVGALYEYRRKRVRH